MSIHIEHRLSFDFRIEQLCKLLIKSFITLHFSYRYLIWIFHSRINRIITHLQVHWCRFKNFTIISAPLKSRLLFNIFNFCMFVTNISYILDAYISKSKQYYNVKPSVYYFYVKTKILEDFHNCISVPLIDLHERALMLLYDDSKITSFRD